MAGKPTLRELQGAIRELRDIVLNVPRLSAKEVQALYRISKSTFYRWRQRGLLPPPVKQPGPFYRRADLEAVERAGKLPRTVTA